MHLLFSKCTSHTLYLWNISIIILVVRKASVLFLGEIIMWSCHFKKLSAGTPHSPTVLQYRGLFMVGKGTVSRGAVLLVRKIQWEARADLRPQACNSTPINYHKTRMLSEELQMQGFTKITARLSNLLFPNCSFHQESLFIGVPNPTLIISQELSACIVYHCNALYGWHCVLSAWSPRYLSWNYKKDIFEYQYDQRTFL